MSSQSEALSDSSEHSARDTGPMRILISAQEETLRRERESLGAVAAETSGLGAEQPEQSPYHDTFGGATPGYQTPGG